MISPSAKRRVRIPLARLMITVLVAAMPAAGVAAPPSTEAQAPSCGRPRGVPTSARQAVVVEATGTTAEVQLRVHDGARWVCKRVGMHARVGRSGIRPLGQRVAGDGTTPAGVFPLATMRAPDGQRFQFFGNGINPRVRGTWRAVRSGDCWDASGGDRTYNTLTHRSAAACGSPDEYLPSYRTAYAQVALIGANMGPARSGDEPGEVPRAGAIFLHRHSYDDAGNTRPTAGCVSLTWADLAAVMRALRPGEAYFVIR